MTEIPEDLIPFNKAAALIPGRPHLATLHRWRLRGVRGRKLQTLLIGGRRFVSKAALAEFLVGDAPKQPQPVCATEPAGAERRRAEVAGKALRALGIGS